MPLDSPEQELQQLIQTVNDGRIVNSASVAAAAWIIWEMVITMEKEVRLVWRTRFSMYQFLYLGLRYCTPVAILLMLAVQTSMSIKFNVEFCKGYLMYLGFGLLIPEVFGEGLIVLRLYALYSRSKKMLLLLVILYCGRLGFAMYSVVVENLTVIVITTDIPITGCLSTPPTNRYLTFWTVGVNLTVSWVYFALTLYKFIQSVPRHTWVEFRAMRQASPLLRLFARDASIYLLMLIIGETLFCIYATKYVDRQLSLMGFPWVMAIYYVAGTRLVFNLREELGGGQMATKELELQQRGGGGAGGKKARSAGMVFADPADVTMEHERTQNTDSSGTRTAGTLDGDIT